MRYRANRLDGLHERNHFHQRNGSSRGNSCSSVHRSILLRDFPAGKPHPCPCSGPRPGTGRDRQGKPDQYPGRSGLHDGRTQTEDGSYFFPPKSRDPWLQPSATFVPENENQGYRPDGSSLVFVIMGDGYRQTEIDSGKFAADAARILSGFDNVSPWDQMLKATNVYRLDVPSNQSGTDYENGLLSGLRDTYFDTSFFTRTVRRSSHHRRLGLCGPRRRPMLQSASACGIRSSSW